MATKQKAVIQWTDYEKKQLFASKELALASSLQKALQSLTKLFNAVERETSSKPSFGFDGVVVVRANVSSKEFEDAVTSALENSKIAYSVNLEKI